MLKERYGLILLAAMILQRAERVPSVKLPELLLIDDASREILFLDIYKRLSALETRTQMSDAVDWTQQSQFDRLKSLAENQQTWLKALEELVAFNGVCKKKLTNKRAAFSAYLDHDIDGTGSAEMRVIVFNQVILNEGEFYNAATGIFTCPWDGVYDLSFFIGQRGRERPMGVWARLYLNDKQIIFAVADAFHNTQDIQGGNRVIIRLTAGDQVKVVSDVSSGIHVEGSEHKSSTFSGVFLFD